MIGIAYGWSRVGEARIYTVTDGVTRYQWDENSPVPTGALMLMFQDLHMQVGLAAHAATGVEEIRRMVEAFIAESAT